MVSGFSSRTVTTSILQERIQSTGNLIAYRQIIKEELQPVLEMVIE